MSSPPPVPGPARRRRPRRRPTILLLMAVVALVALALGAIKYRRDATAWRVRTEALRAELARAEARSVWSQRMHRLGYVSAAQASADRLTAQKAKAELEAFEGR
jgi:hypothetical protein